jgi:hypothetical protein
MDLQQVIQIANGAAAMSRQAVENLNQVNAVVRAQQQQLAQMTAAMQSMSASKKAKDGTLYIEDLPGRRIPFDVVVNIPIGANITSEQPGTYTLSQDGPFVITMRSITFLSSHVFQVTTQNATASFTGRSYGRFRPHHSALDLMDAQGGYSHVTGVAVAAANQGVATAVHPNNVSPFRTMEFDGTIKMQAGSWPRQSGAVPIGAWAPGLDGCMQLPVLDYIERGETIEFMVTPTHINNPQGGNIQSLVGALPYLASGFDSHEGIGYTAPVVAQTADAITRRPDGILSIMLHGFRILAPPGASLV